MNNIHELHHKYDNINFGPDIMDIIFNTKHSSETSPENTNHYIYNIIICCIIVLFIKYLYINENNKYFILFILYIFFIFSSIFLFFISIYLWNNLEKNYD